MTWTDFFRFLVPSVVIVLGWAVVHWLTKEREKSTHRRQIAVQHCDSLISAATTLHDSVVSYHSTPRDRALERRIVAGFSSIGLSCSVFHRFGVDAPTQAAIIDAHLDFKAASTGWHFQDEHDASCSPDSEEIAAIGIAFELFIKQVQQTKLDFVCP